MPKIYILPILLLLVTASLPGQTILKPGDIAVIAIASDMGACGAPAQSDELSFVCFKDITNGTTIDITDNGWETGIAGFWGNSEGTLSLGRTGGTIPKGTVITLQARNLPAGWNYKVISPDNGWAITNVNLPAVVISILKTVALRRQVLQGETRFILCRAEPGVTGEVRIREPTMAEQFCLVLTPWCMGSRWDNTHVEPASGCYSMLPCRIVS
jgi:hypothetical protein